MLLEYLSPRRRAEKKVLEAEGSELEILEERRDDYRQMRNELVWDFPRYGGTLWKASNPLKSMELEGLEDGFRDREDYRTGPG